MASNVSNVTMEKCGTKIISLAVALPAPLSEVMANAISNSNAQEAELGCKTFGVANVQLPLSGMETIVF